MVVGIANYIRITSKGNIVPALLEALGAAALDVRFRI